MRETMFLKALDDVEIQRHLFQQCRDDILFFFDYFLWTCDPKAAPFDFPFIPWGPQRQLILDYQEEIRQGKSSLTEKSRDMGATYCLLGTYLHEFLFANNFEALLISHRQEDVDNPTPSSLFGKLRYMLYALPAWMVPLNFDRRKHSSFCTLLNPEKGNSIVGQATTEDAGRSGRKTAVLIDEHAAIPARIIEGIERSLQEVTNTIQRLSTPRGINLFKKLRDKGACKIHTLHWTRDPRKNKGLYYFQDGKRIDCPNISPDRISPYGYYIDAAGRVTRGKFRSPWYDKKCTEYPTLRDVAQELDIDYAGSGNCRFSVDMINEKSKAVRDGRRGRLEDRNGQIVFVESDPGAEFEMEVWEFPTEPYFNNRSCIGVDTAEGLENGDYCSADVIVMDTKNFTRRHAASLHGHFEPDIWADKLYVLGRWYDAGCELIIERNKDGLGVCLRLRNHLGYNNLYYDKKGAEAEDRIGFTTTAQKKFIITGDLDKALRDGELITESVNHFSEMTTFINTNGKLGATGGNNDDRVISLSLANFLIQQYSRPTLRDFGREPLQKRTKINLSQF